MRRLFPGAMAFVSLTHLVCLPSTDAMTVEGVDIPPSITMEGARLSLNGAGIREITFLGARIKLYVASFYTPAPVKSLEQALASPGPIVLNMTFLKKIPASLVAKSWRDQFAKPSVLSTSYSGALVDQERFITLLGDFDDHGRDTVVLTGEETRVLDQGKIQGVIKGRNFQKCFLELLLGPNPISKTLRADLFHGAVSSE